MQQRRAMKFVIIDTETTGLDPDKHEVIEFGAVVLIDHKVVEKLEIKIQPRAIYTADPEAMRVNGYNEYKWRFALSQQDAARMIWTFIERHRDGVTVGHNLNFDRKFLEAFGRSNGIDIRLTSPYLDTRDLCRAVLAQYGLSSMRLDAVCEFLGWRRRDAHTALSDCEDCARLLQNICPPQIKFLARLEIRRGINRVRSLL